MSTDDPRLALAKQLRELIVKRSFGEISLVLDQARMHICPECELRYYGVHPASRFVSDCNNGIVERIMET